MRRFGPVTPLRDLSESELRAARARGAAARLEFNRTLTGLREQVTQEDPIEALARAAFYLSVGQSRRRPGSKSRGLEVFHLEILQALALSAPRSRKAPLGDAAAHAQRNFDLIDANGRAYRDMAQEHWVADSAGNAQRAILDLVRLWTFAVRGARHVHQTDEYAEAFTTRVDRYFRPVHGCSAVSVLEMLQAVLKLITSRFEDHAAKFRLWMRKSTATAMVTAYAEAYPGTDLRELQQRLGGRPKREVFASLWNLAETRLGAVYTFDNDEVIPDAPAKDQQALRAILSRLSISFEELTSDDLRHLHVSNPVRLRPIIRLSETQSYCCCPQAMAMAMAEIFQTLCVAPASLKERSEGVRADWLEEKLAAVVTTGFPSAIVHTSVKQHDASGSTLWESDVVALIDKRVLIFEAKSGKLQAAAARGAVSSLKTDLKKLVAEASQQSSHLGRLLETAKEPLHLTSDQGPLVIDPGEVRSVTRLNVLLDPIGPLLANSPRLVAAGLIKPDVDLSPSMTIFELETVLEVVSFELERCYYLARRAEFERNVTYTADELDLLGFYLQTQFNVGEDEFEGRDFQLYGLSEEYATGYSEAQSAGLAPPKVRRTALWTRLLTLLESERVIGWTRLGQRLLRVDYEGQELFERTLRQGFREVARHPNTFFTTGFTYGAPGRQHTVALCIGAPTGSPLFEDNVAYACNAAFSQSGLNDLLLVYWSAPPTENAYDFMGIMTRPRRGAAAPPHAC